MIRRVLPVILLLSVMTLESCAKDSNFSVLQPDSTTVPAQEVTPTPTLPSVELDEAWLDFLNGTATPDDKETISEGIDIFINANIGACIKNEALVDTANVTYFFGMTNHSELNELPRIDFEQEIINTWKSSGLPSFAEYNIVFEQLTDMSGEDEGFCMIAFLAN